MKKVFLPAFLAILIIFGLIFRNPIFATGRDLVYYSPCDTPITYRVGTIDKGFEVTKEELIEDLQVAANIWNSQHSKPLLVYDPNSTFTVNMVYDSRQALTSEINKLNSNLKEKQEDIDPQIERFKARQAEFEVKVRALNEEIQYWNNNGGAPKEEYEKLLEKQSALRAEAAQLNAEGVELGQKAQDYNVNAEKLNNTIGNYQQVLEYKPEEGLYEQEGGKRKISIYIDVDQDEFLHTLAHEFGHALGLDHDENKQSIMYPQTNSVLTPSTSEISQLQSICQQRTVFEVGAKRIALVVRIIEERLSEELKNRQNNENQNPGK